MVEWGQKNEVRGLLCDASKMLWIAQKVFLTYFETLKWCGKILDQKVSVILGLGKMGFENKNLLSLMLLKISKMQSSSFENLIIMKTKVF